ncbi:MAG: TerB family tellurite resistance protein [Bacteroidota bacterium]
MVYLVAIADGLIQPEETEELERLLIGRDWSQPVKWSFDELVAHPLDPAAVYEEVMEVFVAHGPDPAYQELFEILEAVAQASDGLDSEEANVLIDLEVDLRKRFLEDFERFDLRYKQDAEEE